jgi:hypothetical protein
MTRLLFTPLDEEHCGVDEIRKHTTDDDTGLERDGVERRTRTRMMGAASYIPHANTDPNRT